MKLEKNIRREGKDFPKICNAHFHIMRIFTCLGHHGLLLKSDSKSINSYIVYYLTKASSEQ